MRAKSPTPRVRDGKPDLACVTATSILRALANDPKAGIASRVWAKKLLNGAVRK